MHCSDCTDQFLLAHYQPGITSSNMHEIHGFLSRSKRSVRYTVGVFALPSVASRRVASHRESMEGEKERYTERRDNAVAKSKHPAIRSQLNSIVNTIILPIHS